MSKVVVDSSIALKWVLVEEDSDKAIKLLNQWENEGIELIAPALFFYEITNIIYRQTMKNTSYAEALQKQQDAFSLGITIHSSSLEMISTRAMELAHKFKLPATYDAHYFALAEIEGCECWTADMRLLNAVKGKIPWVRSLDDYTLSADE